MPNSLQRCMARNTLLELQGLDVAKGDHTEDLHWADAPASSMYLFSLPHRRASSPGSQRESTAAAHLSQNSSSSHVSSMSGPEARFPSSGSD